MLGRKMRENLRPEGGKEAACEEPQHRRQGGCHERDAGVHTWGMPLLGARQKEMEDTDEATSSRA